MDGYYERLVFGRHLKVICCMLVAFVLRVTRENFCEPCCSVELQTNSEISRRSVKYLSLFGHNVGMVLDMHATARFVFL